MRKKFNLPLKYSSEGFQDLAYPIWNGFQSGILATPEFVAAGSTYAADVFVKTSVAKKELKAAITLANPSDKEASGELLWQAVEATTGAVAKTFAAKTFTVAARGEHTLQVSENWENPKLWWPDDPNMYRLRTTVKMNDQAIDITDTSFGFRQ